METHNLGDNILPEVCPVDGAKCDRRCGFKAHMTLKRKNRCLNCGAGLAPATECFKTDADEWDGHSFRCEANCANDTSLIVSIG